MVLDALCETDDGSMANIEVQKADDDNHQKRVRFNQSNIDATLTEKGIKYKDLPDVYMVFISRFDIFDRGRTVYHISRVIDETGETVENGVHEIYANIAVDDGSEIAELMKYFKDSNGTNRKFAKLCSRVDYFKHKKEGVKIMATLFEKYVAEERAEEQKKGIRNMAETYHKFKQDPALAKEAVIEKYADVDAYIIDDILDEVYGLGK